MPERLDEIQSALRDVLVEYEELRDSTSEYGREMAVAALGIAIQTLQTAVESAATPGDPNA